MGRVADEGRESRGEGGADEARAEQRGGGADEGRMKLEQRRGEGVG